MSEPVLKAPRVRIVNDDGRGYMTRIYIDDQDVSECFSAVKITAGTKGALVAELDAIAVAVDVHNVEQLRIPSETTRDVLIRHGWTPPAEPVTVVSEQRRIQPPKNFEPLAPGLFGDDEPVRGHELVERFYERLRDDWEPSEEDRFTIERVYDEDDQPVPGKTRYTLAVVLDSERPQPGDEAQRGPRTPKAELNMIVEARRLCETGEAKAIRQAAGLSLAEVARLAQASGPTVHRWENRTRRPKGARAVRYYQALMHLQRLSASHTSTEEAA
jgi:DNA-binding transcriptional regulator YiaG